MPRIPAAALILGSAVQLGNSKRHRLCAHTSPYARFLWLSVYMSCKFRFISFALFIVSPEFRRTAKSIGNSNSQVISVSSAFEGNEFLIFVRLDEKWCFSYCRLVYWLLSIWRNIRRNPYHHSLSAEVSRCWKTGSHWYRRVLHQLHDMSRRDS